MTPKYLIFILVTAYVTQYGWTGSRMANGQYPFIGAIACPRNIPLGSRVKIMDYIYTCSDRTARRFDGRFDIFSTGTKKEMLQWGKKRLNVQIYD